MAELDASLVCSAGPLLIGIAFAVVLGSWFEDLHKTQQMYACLHTYGKRSILVAAGASEC